MTTDLPRLSHDLTGPRSYDACQHCGLVSDALQTWQEHDQDDKPEVVYLRLCKPCSETLIEPHPRLYAKLDPGAPAPGAMPCCEGCKHCEHLRCHSPMLKDNGGSGLPIRPRIEGHAIACTRGRGCRPITLYAGFPTCDGREAQQ